MERDISLQAIVLQNRRTGESNRNLTLLSLENGVFEVTIYGARKSRAKVRVMQFMQATFYLYYYPKGKRYILKDIQPICDNDGINEDYGRVIAANVMCEFILKTGCEDMAYAFELLQDSLKIVALGSVPVDLVVIQFLLRMIRENGFFSSFNTCPVCDRHIKDDELLSFNPELSAPCCEQCGTMGVSMILPPGARKYLSLTIDMDLTQALSITLNPVTSGRIRGYMQRWAQHVIGRPLKSLESLV